MVNVTCIKCNRKGSLTVKQTKSKGITYEYWYVEHHIGNKIKWCYLGKYEKLPDEYKKLIHKNTQTDTQNKEPKISLKSQNIIMKLAESPGSIVRSRSLYSNNNILESFKRFLSIDLALEPVSVINHLCKTRKMLSCFNKPLNNVTKDDIRQFLEMVKENYSINTYSCFIKTIRRLFRDFLNKPELAKFRFPTIPFTPKILDFNKADLQRFYYAIEHDIVRMMFLAYCVTGLRRNDIMFLMLSELNRDMRMIIKNNGSSTKHRWITFYNEELEKTLNEYLDSRNDNNPRVFVVDKFKTFQKHWKIAQKTTGLSITPKDLRNWFCNEMMNLGVPERYVDAYCGRVPRTILRRHYTDYSPNKLKEIYDRAKLRLLS